MKEKKGIPFEAVMAAVIIVIILAMAVDGFLIQKMPMEAAKYPIFVFAVAIAAGVAEIVRCFRKQKTDETRKPVFADRKNFLFIVCAIVVYMFLMWLVGFIVSTIAFTVAFTLRFRMKNLIAVNIGAAAVIVAIYFIFVKLLYIFLPAGVLFDAIF